MYLGRPHRVLLSFNPHKTRKRIKFCIEKLIINSAGELGFRGLISKSASLIWGSVKLLRVRVGGLVCRSAGKAGFHWRAVELGPLW